MNRLFAALARRLVDLRGDRFGQQRYPDARPSDDLHTQALLPPSRQRYLSEIADTVRGYHHWAGQQIEIATRLDQIEGAISQLEAADELVPATLQTLRDSLQSRLDHLPAQVLEQWETLRARYTADELLTRVRGRESRSPLFRTSLSGTRIPRLALPRTRHKGERLRFALKENLPGFYPFTAGVFALKREEEDPTRMFAGEGTPERTNRRFHYLSRGMPAARLSTAFDSVTLYGEDPDRRPDIYGKIGNSGVSVCTLDDMKKLYAGFDLCAPTTSVSMTINGPAPMILAMFLNTAMRQCRSGPSNASPARRHVPG